MKLFARSALDLSWLDEISADDPVFISAQGLFMYFKEEEVKKLIISIAERFPGAQLMFDAIPHFFSRKTLRGYKKTRHYQVPPMPWAASQGEIAGLLKSWSGQVKQVQIVSYGALRGGMGLVLRIMSRLPVTRNNLPTIVRVELFG